MIFRAGVAWCLAVGSALAGQNVVVVFDDSGSMASHLRSNRSVRKIEAARNALSVVLDKLPEDAQVGVLALNAGWVIPLQPVDRARLPERINSIGAKGGTPLGQYLKVAADTLLQTRDEQLYGEYRMLVLSDGEANDQPYLEAVLPDLMSRGVVVDVIGVDMEADHSLATRVHSYRRADDPEALQRAIAEALAESDAYAAGGESDFELLEGFPVEVASLMISTLAGTENQPIRTSHVQAPPTPNAPISPVPTGRGGNSAFGRVIFIGVVLFLFSSFLSVIKGRRRN